MKTYAEPATLSDQHDRTASFERPTPPASQRMTVAEREEMVIQWLLDGVEPGHAPSFDIRNPESVRTEAIRAIEDRVNSICEQLDAVITDELRGYGPFPGQEPLSTPTERNAASGAFLRVENHPMTDAARSSGFSPSPKSPIDGTVDVSATDREAVSPIDFRPEVGSDRDASESADATRLASEAALARMDALMTEAEAVFAGDDAPITASATPPSAGQRVETTTVSIVVPVFNEVATIGPVVQRLTSLPLRTEVIVVDDGSTDGTRESLAQAAIDHPGLVVVTGTVNQGKGAAIRAALSHVTGEIVVIQDADLEYDPAAIASLMEPIVYGEADVVYGSRYHGGRTPGRWLHRLGNAALTVASNLTTGLRLTDMETCQKAFRTEAILGTVIAENRFGFEPEVTAKLARQGWRFAERPVSYTPRSYAQGKKIGLADLARTIHCIIKYGLGL